MQFAANKKTESREIETIKITVKKMWKEKYDYQQKEYVNESIQKKLFLILQSEFEENAEEILSYLMEQYHHCVKEKIEMEQEMIIGNNIIKAKKTDAMSLEFTITKLSS